MLIVIAAIIFYFFKLKKSTTFLKYGVASFLYFVIVGNLLHGETGLITQYVKELIGDSPVVAVYAIFVVAVVWGGTGWILKSGVRKAKVPINPLESPILEKENNSNG